MPAAQRPSLQPRARKPPPKLRSLPTPLRIEQEEHVQAINLVLEESPASAFSDQSEADSIQPPTRPKSLRNQKKLSLNLSAHSNASSTSLNIPDSPVSTAPAASSTAATATANFAAQRRPSIVSLPNGTVVAHRRDEEASPSAPYIDGPVEILPGIWIGSEDNARDWKSLVERGIRSILNVAKEVASPYVPAGEAPLRSTVSTPNLVLKFNDRTTKDPTYVPPHLPSGRPAMHYLRLPWSHGQADLVRSGFIEGMAFVDWARARGDGVLIHCQCGVSRSATMVIALVMRAAHSDSPSVPAEVSALRNGGMHASYAFVKDKSKWVGPNMSLMYQLLEYERTLSAGSRSPASDHSSQLASEEAEWGRRRQEMEEETSPVDDVENFPFMDEARALDLAMEQRIVARKGSQYSTNSSTGSSGHGMGSTWKSRFGYGSRSRAGSVASNFTNHSILSEDLLEEDEDNVDSALEANGDTSSGSPSLEFPPDDVRFPMQFRFKGTSLDGPPPTAPASKQSFGLLPPPSANYMKTSFGNMPPPTAPASKQTFTLSAPPKKFQKKRPPILLPPVPPSPVGMKTQAQEEQQPATTSQKRAKRVPTPLRIPATPSSRRSSRSSVTSSNLVVPTPSQTLFVFPPEESITTPSTMTLTSTFSPGVFSPMITPRVSTFNKAGRRRSLIIGAPPTPTTACSRVDVLGYVARGS